MFIPRGKAIYEDLATSYVLVDALVDDFCEGGFSGVIEVVLRDTDSRVIIDRGKVVTVVQEGGGPASHTTVAELAKRSRAERGRVSVYSHPTEVVAALADCARAEPLYTHLSTEFADLGKMISKLARERDRQWFIEVNAQSGARALIHLKDGRCRIITPDAEMVEAEGGELMNDAALRRLVDECNREGATLDVYFKRAAGDVPAEEPQAESPEARGVIAAQEQSGGTTSADGEPSPSAYRTNEMGVPPEIVVAAPAHEARDEPRDARVSGSEGGPQSALDEDEMVKPSRPLDVPEDMLAASLNTSPPSVSSGVAGRELAEDLAIARGDFSAASDPGDAGEAVVMVEVKRLMGEMARAIEDAAREVEQKEIFPMHLRAGQLKVADRYPFLDPFGDEFEYLSGEIAFIGTASPAPFIAGLTEALVLAVGGLIQSSSQPARLRAQIAQGLGALLERSRQELEPFGLDESIHRVLAQ